MVKWFKGSAKPPKYRPIKVREVVQANNGRVIVKLINGETLTQDFTTKVQVYNKCSRHAIAMADSITGHIAYYYDLDEPHNLTITVQNKQIPVRSILHIECIDLKTTTPIEVEYTKEEIVE